MIIAKLNELSNQYVLPLYLNAGEYTGTSADWTRVAQGGVYTIPSPEFELGSYVQWGKRCCQIIEKEPAGVTTQYRLYPSPDESNVAVTNTAFYVNVMGLRPLQQRYSLLHRGRIGDITFEWREII